MSQNKESRGCGEKAFVKRRNGGLEECEMEECEYKV